MCTLVPSSPSTHCDLRAGGVLRALAAGSASAGDLRSGNNPGALIGTRYFSRYLTATFAALGLMLVAPTSSSHAQAPDLGAASTFAVLAGQTVTNTVTSTVINGDLGVWPGSAITNFPPGAVVAPYAIHAGDAVALRAQSANVTAYNNLMGRSGTNESGVDLGTLTLGPGVYSWGNSAQLTGTLHLSGTGIYVFNIGSTLVTATGSIVTGVPGSDVFWRVGSSATLGVNSTFIGDILALTSIQLLTGAKIDCGAAWAQNGAVTLDHNTINICNTSAAPASLVPSSASANQLAIANAINTFVQNGGTLPPEILALLQSGLSPSQLANALTQLSGEAGTGVAPTGVQATNSFLSLVLSPFEEERSVPIGLPVKALGYGPEAGQPFTYAPDPRRWSVWGAAYGGQSNTGGDLAAGTHDRSEGVFGFASGFDYRLTPDTRIGFALAGGGTNFGLSNGLGNGRSDMFQAAIYGRTNFNAAYVAAVLAYGWYDVSTNRFVMTDNLTANFSAHDIAGRIEGGYRFVMPNIFGLPGYGWITPYAALQVQAFYTPSYDESAASGSPVFALTYAAHTTTMTRTELGVWTTRTIALNNDAILVLRTRTAWAHDDWSNPSTTAMFLSMPGSGFFTVNGATPTSDSLLFLAGAEIKFNNGVSVGGWFDSEFAQRSQTYAGTARLRYTF
jgi:uncharacterized protein with beta-barrel porin domain